MLDLNQLALLPKNPMTATRNRIALSLVILMAALSLAAAEISGTLRAPVQAGSSVAAAWIDLPKIMRSATPDPAKISVTLQPVDFSTTDPEYDLQAQLRAVDGGFYQILWPVPMASAEYPIGSLREFRFTIVQKSPDTAAAPLRANLIENGDFSKPLPATPNFEGMQVVPLPEGGNALSFENDKEGNGPIYWAPVIAVTPGESYEISFRYKIENAVAHPNYGLTFYGWFNFQDAEGNPLYLNEEQSLENRESVTSTAATDTDGWQEVNVVITAPPDAARASLNLRNGSTVPHSVMIMDLRIVPTSLPSAEMKAPGSAAVLPAAHPTADVSRRFDFGPPNGVTQYGFTAVSPEDTYRADPGWGFLKLTRPDAIDGRRPDALGRDFITDGDAEFQVDLPNGEYLVWFLIGDAGGSNSVVQRFFLTNS